MSKKKLLIAEYTAITDHFRAYQSNRLNIILLAIPSVGAIMLNAIDKNNILQILCLLMLYLIIFFLVLIDNVFMRRLRNYTIRLAAIEKKFSVFGHARHRLTNKNSPQDATTNTIRHVLQGLNTFIALYSTIILYNMRINEIYWSTLEFKILVCFIVSIPVIISIVFYFRIKNKVNTSILSNSNILAKQ